MNTKVLLNHFDRISEAPEAYERFRRFVLDLAVRGKMVLQIPTEEPASALLERIYSEKVKYAKGKGPVRNESPIGIGDEHAPFVIPSGWEWVSLSSVSRRIHYGFTASANPSLRDVRLLRITDIQNNAVDWSSVPGCQISEHEVDQFRLYQGDILIARTGGTIGKTFLVRETPVRAVFASYLIRIQKATEFNDRYLKLFLESPSYWKQLKEGSRGGGQPNVNGQALGKMAIAVPPLAEQARIVDKVDEVMALCNRLKLAQEERENRRRRLASASLFRLSTDTSAEGFISDARFYLDHMPSLVTNEDQIKQLRQTILSLAIRGRLVPQDPTDEHVSEFLKRIQKVSVLAPSDVPDDGRPFPIPASWQWIRLGQIVTDADSGWSPQTEGFSRSGDNWGVLKVSAVSWDRFLPDENKQLLPNTVPPERAKVRLGDFLISRANTSELVAKCVVVEREPSNLILSDKIVRLQIAEGCSKKFLCMVNNHAAHSRSYYAEEASGTSLSMKNVSRAVIYGLAVPLPPLAEQNRIVSKVDELMALCVQLKDKLADVEGQSIRLLEATLSKALSDDVGTRSALPIDTAMSAI